jgi:hypothetical protein
VPIRWHAQVRRLLATGFQKAIGGEAVFQAAPAGIHPLAGLFHRDAIATPSWAARAGRPAA